MRALIAVLLLGLVLVLAPPAHAAQDRFFETSDGIRLHYEEAGRGQTIVFVPGWTMPAWIWTAQIADLSRFYHVVAFDPRSQGESEIAASGHEPLRRGQDIAELVGHLGPQPVVLVGWSLGVLDVLSYIHNSGDAHVAGLVLVDNSVGEDPAPAIQVGAHRTLSRRPGPRPKPVSREVSMRAFVRNMFLRQPSEEYIDRLTAACLRTPPAVAAELLSYPVPRTYWRDAIYSTTKPVLYIVRPRLAGQAANLAARHAATESEVWDDVGHALFVEQPERFDATVQAFLKRRVWP